MYFSSHYKINSDFRNVKTNTVLQYWTTRWQSSTASACTTLKVVVVHIDSSKLGTKYAEFNCHLKHLY